MAELTKSSVIAFKEESTEGVLIDIASGAEFCPLRDGFSFEGSVDSLDSDELVAGSIGASKSFATKESPTASYPIYWKHSGVEGQAPQYAVLLKSAMGLQTDNATEYDTIAGSSVSAPKVDTGEGVNFSVGQALLVKDGVNGYSIRNVKSISGDDLSLNFDLANAPASGVNLGKSIFFAPGTSHPTYSAWRHQAASGAAFKDAMAGCKTNSISMDFSANGFAEGSIDFGGIAFYFDPIRVTAASNDKIDFNDGAVQVATIEAKVYQSPIELAREIASKLNAQSTDVISCSYSSSTGKYTLSSDGVTFELPWNTGANAGTTLGADIGFSVAADDTGATSYIGDNALDFDPAVTPSYDVSDNLVIKGAEILLGENDDIVCKKATQVSFSIGTPKTDVPDVCASSGVDSSVILEREVTFSAQLILEQYQVDLFDKFINNTTTQVMFNSGPKSAGNWEAGKSMNIYLANASITAYPVADQDGYQVVNLEAKAFVGSSSEDVYINFL